MQTNTGKSCTSRTVTADLNTNICVTIFALKSKIVQRSTFLFNLNPVFIGPVASELMYRREYRFHRYNYIFSLSALLYGNIPLAVHCTISICKFSFLSEKVDNGRRRGRPRIKVKHVRYHKETNRFPSPLQALSVFAYQVHEPIKGNDVSHQDTSQAGKVPREDLTALTLVDQLVNDAHRSRAERCRDDVQAGYVLRLRDARTVATSPVVLRWLCDSPRTGCAWRTTPYIYVTRTSNNRVTMACEIYCCLLPQCEALRTCRSGFPIATEPQHRSTNCKHHQKDEIHGCKHLGLGGSQISSARIATIHC